MASRTISVGLVSCSPCPCPRGTLGISAPQGWGLLLAWGCLPTFTPPSLPTAGWGPWAWLRPLWPQCEGRAGGTASAFLKINRPQGNQRSRAGRQRGRGWSGGEGGGSGLVWGFSGAQQHGDFLVGRKSAFLLPLPLLFFRPSFFSSVFLCLLCPSLSIPAFFVYSTFLFSSFLSSFPPFSFGSLPTSAHSGQLPLWSRFPPGGLLGQVFPL